MKTMRVVKLVDALQGYFGHIDSDTLADLAFDLPDNFEAALTAEKERADTAVKRAEYRYREWDKANNHIRELQDRVEKAEARVKELEEQLEGTRVMRPKKTKTVADWLIENSEGSGRWDLFEGKPEEQIKAALGLLGQHRTGRYQKIDGTERIVEVQDED